jgi:predicted phage tail protein
MITDIESVTSDEGKVSHTQVRGWIKVTAATTVSMVLGGLAVAWWYRKTLTKLRETGENTKNPHFGMPEEELAGSIHDA